MLARRSALPRAALLRQRAVYLPRLSAARYLSDATPTNPEPKAAPNASSSGIQPGSVLDNARRGIKIALITFGTVLTVSGVGWATGQYWIETHELTPETDPEVIRWQWDAEADHWNGDRLAGGTDPNLGTLARVSLRSAWLELNRAPEMDNVALVAAYARRVDSLLQSAILLAEEESTRRKLHPRTLYELHARRAEALERLGSPSDAAQAYAAAWRAGGQDGPEAARIAMKLGDVQARLSQPETALAWWNKALQLATGSSDALPKAPPASPLAKRTMMSTLMSLSSFRASSGQLADAECVQTTGLDLLRAMKAPPLNLASPPEALHYLFLMNASAVLGLHLAEVTYARQKKKDPAPPLHWLLQSAKISERVANLLTGQAADEQPNSTHGVVAKFVESRAMQRPARDLLRDARRTAAEAWNLAGVLKERAEPGNPRAALDCYKRAVRWAGTDPDAEDAYNNAGVDTRRADWRVYLNNYRRAKEAVEGKQGEAA
ncbi:hypothetical protein GGF50DRAFT_123309 [Schizophyllum commune]